MSHVTCPRSILAIFDVSTFASSNIYPVFRGFVLLPWLLYNDLEIQLVDEEEGFFFFKSLNVSKVSSKPRYYNWG